MSAVNGKDERSQAALFGAEAGEDGPYVGVVLNRPVDQVWTYRVPERLRDHVQVGHEGAGAAGTGQQPGGRLLRAARTPAPPVDLDRGRVKDVLEVLDEPPLIDAAMLELTRWMGTYYACSWGQALDAVVPAGVKKGAGHAGQDLPGRARGGRRPTDARRRDPQAARVAGAACYARPSR